MKWSVALFGHYKPRYELREKLSSKVVSRHIEKPVGFDPDLYFVYEVTGWEGRATPGDIIAYRPFPEKHKWTVYERCAFLVVTFKSGLSESQMQALCEPLWDTDSYPELPSPIPWDKLGTDSLSLTPTKHLKKRRFCITLNVLEDAGVDLVAMLNKDLFYDPGPSIRDFEELDCYDRVKDQKVTKADNLTLLKPKIITRAGELQGP